jgi:hypothetical protein
VRSVSPTCRSVARAAPIHAGSECFGSSPAVTPSSHASRMRSVGIDRPRESNEGKSGIGRMSADRSRHHVPSVIHGQSSDVRHSPRETAYASRYRLFTFRPPSSPCAERMESTISRTSGRTTQLKLMVNPFISATGPIPRLIGWYTHLDRDTSVSAGCGHKSTQSAARRGSRIDAAAQKGCTQALEQRGCTQRGCNGREARRGEGGWGIAQCMHAPTPRSCTRFDSPRVSRTDRSAHTRTGCVLGLSHAHRTPRIAAHRASGGPTRLQNPTDPPSLERHATTTYHPPSMQLISRTEQKHPHHANTWGPTVRALCSVPPALCCWYLTAVYPNGLLNLPIFILDVTSVLLAESPDPAHASQSRIRPSFSPLFWLWGG